MGEGKKDASLLREVHHLLTQGKSDEAHVLLARVIAETPIQHHELGYLQAWDAVVQEQWEMVIQYVQDLPILLDIEKRGSLLTNGSVRRRRPMCLLMLGEMARKLNYPEEATEHLQHCLALLSERRMNIPDVRLMTHGSLGRLALEMNQTAQARLQFEIASRLCQEEKPDPPLHAAILTGLCETLFRLEQYESALASGKQALRLLQESTPPRCQEQLLLLLGRISLALADNASALAYVQDARHSASQTHDAARVASTLLALAEIQQEEHQQQEARASCQEALTLLADTPEHPLYGNALFLGGKLAEAWWREHLEQETAAKEALAYYEQALAFFTERHETAALARVSRHLARFLETRDEPELALVHWKNAFKHSRQED